jgi:hypothetical protein
MKTLNFMTLNVTRMRAMAWVHRVPLISGPGRLRTGEQRRGGQSDGTVQSGFLGNSGIVAIY